MPRLAFLVNVQNVNNLITLDFIRDERFEISGFDGRYFSVKNITSGTLF